MVHHFFLNLQRGQTSTTSNRRDRLRIIEDGEDVTPRGLTHPQYNILKERRTVFDSVALNTGIEPNFPSTITVSNNNQVRPSLATTSSISSILMSIEDSTESKTESSDDLKQKISPFPFRPVEIEDVGTDDDAPSQYHLSRYI